MAQGWRKAMAYLGLVDDPDADYGDPYGDAYDDPYQEAYADPYADPYGDEPTPRGGHRDEYGDEFGDRADERRRDRRAEPERARGGAPRRGGRPAMARGPATESGAVTVVRPARGREDPGPERTSDAGPDPRDRIPLRPARVAGPAARVHVMVPSGFDDAQEVGDRFKASQPVIINLQGVDRDLQRRLIDFSSGLAYALGGQLSKAAEQVFLLTPSDVIVSDEEKERLQAEGLYRHG